MDTLPSGYVAFGAIALVAVNIIMAFGVYFEAERYRSITGQKTAFFHPVVWFFVGLSTGIMGAILFWLSHWLAPKNELAARQKISNKN